MSFLISEFGQYKSFELPDYKGLIVKKSLKSNQINQDTDLHSSNEPTARSKHSNKKSNITSLYTKQEEIYNNHHKISYAHELMSKNISIADENESLETIKKIMISKNQHHIPILKNDIVIGIMTVKDLLKESSGRIKDIMTKKIVIAFESTPVNDLAKIMCAENIGCLPILNTEKEMVGIVTQSDILHLLAVQRLF